MERIKQNLEAARADLQSIQRQIAFSRKAGYDPASAPGSRIVRDFYRALDRVADLQSMASASF